MSDRDRGFTLIELLTISPVVLLAIGGFVVAIITMTGEALASRATNSLAYEVDAALGQIRQDVRTANAFLATNSFTIAAPQGLDDAGADFTGDGNALILAMSATTANPLTPSSTAKLVDSPYPCGNPLINQNESLEVNVVYFVKDNTLWRRVLMPADYASTTCTLPWQLPSCTPGYSASFCKTSDMRMVEGVSETGLTLQYFAGRSDNVANQFVINPDASTEARAGVMTEMKSLSVAILAEKRVANRTVSWSASLRMSLGL